MTTSVSSARPAEILLAEDNQDDVLLTRRSFQGTRYPLNLHHVENGEECMAYLRKTGHYVDVLTPDLVLLDLNMPVMDGREVMAELMAEDGLRGIPVVVLTTSEDERDIRDMYRSRCNSYIVKPVDFDQFQSAIEILTHYWFSVAILPGRD